MEVEDFLRNASIEELLNRLIRLAGSNTPDSTEELKRFLRVRDGHTFDKHTIPRLISQALLQKGPAGVAALDQALHEAAGPIYRNAIIETLWYASRGEVSRRLIGWLLPGDCILNNPPTNETVREARYRLHDIVLQSHTDEDLFDSLMQFLYLANMVAGKDEAETFRSAVFGILAEASIKISHRLIEEFETLVDQGLREEEYQRFFAIHPVFLDPLATEVISKQRLGIERITDFAVRRLDNEYILVEIEKPQDRIFTDGGDFTASFTHAFGQIIDFQEWIDQHAEYARHLMPEISSPKGLLIIGRRAGFAQEQLAKLKRFSINSNSIEMLTYDDVIQRAKSLHTNIFNESQKVW